MRDAALSALDQLDAAAAEAEGTFQMDEDAFRLFYERTSRPVWAYLARMSGSARLAGLLTGKRSSILAMEISVPTSRLTVNSPLR